MLFKTLAIITLSLNLFAAKIEVHGHRGARSILPENTIPAFKYALEVGVDVLEFDLIVSKDDIVVVNHDLTIDEDICVYPKKNQPVRELTLKEIKRIDCGSLKNSRFPKQTPVPGTKIPTLDEVFEFVSKSKIPYAKTVRFNIETKIDSKTPEMTPAPDKYVRLIYEIVKKYNFQNRIILQSFEMSTLEAMHRLDPNIKTSFLNMKVNKRFVKKASSLNVPIISPYHKKLPKKYVKKLQAKGLKVIPWTANSERHWDALIDKGVDGIITDDPAALIKYLKKKGLR